MGLFILAAESVHDRHYSEAENGDPATPSLSYPSAADAALHQLSIGSLTGRRSTYYRLPQEWRGRHDRREPARESILAHLLVKLPEIAGEALHALNPAERAHVVAEVEGAEGHIPTGEDVLVHWLQLTGHRIPLQHDEDKHAVEVS